MGSIKCADCKTIIDESFDTRVDERMQCPRCRSTTRLFCVALEASLQPHGKLHYKGKRGGKGKAFVEGIIGADWSYKLHCWLRLERVIDRDNDRYTEKLVNTNTSEVVHECYEPLSQHRGHGSAKPRRTL